MSAKPLSATGLSDATSFELLVKSVTDYAIYMLNPEGRIVTWNAGAQRFKGYTRDEIIGHHFSEFYSEEDRAAGLPARALGTAAREGRFEGEGWRMRKDGSRFWAHVVIDRISDDSGALIGFAKITRDITERRQAAEELEQTRASLFQAQKMEAIGKLTGGIAHDFNNLLTVIVNSLDMLAREQQTVSGKRLIESAQRAAARGATLTQQLLAFARGQPLQQEQYDINTLLRDFETVLRRACLDRASFEMQLAPRLRRTLLDAAQFEVALLNLVVNARDAMPSGGHITIRTENLLLERRDRIGTLKPGFYVKIVVQDTGVGMTPDIIQRAFEPFFTTKEIGNGTGMGLSQVYGFVTQSGGDVILASKPGEGTSVSIYLPALAGTAEEERSLLDAIGHPAPHKETVLIVEDEPDVLEVTTELFRYMGYEVITASNGLDAIDILKRKRDIDVLFTDVMMPKGMSGIELGRFTQKLCPNVRVILASGYPLPALADEHNDLGNFNFISKPFRWEILETTLKGLPDAS
ncbi:MAG TPA: PAS domain S-box protein [Paucimonas sp.]|nr:PAS domain S-box protein [Paucimonas sp.]